MSLNMGTEAVTAVHELRSNRDFDRFVTALGVLTQTKLLGAVASQVDVRTDATAYARGMYDLWEAIHSAYTGTAISQVKPPPLRGRQAVREALDV